MDKSTPPLCEKLGTEMKKKVGLSVLMGICLGLVLILMSDVISFVSIQRGDYKTPWYDARFRKDPVTHAVLWFCPSERKVCTNVVGDLWLVKETKVGEKTYWTRLAILEKKQ
jgi:hypothetical protein